MDLSAKTLENLNSSAKDFIQKEYEGIFTHDQMLDHFNSYIELASSKALIQQVWALASLSLGDKILDLGCGFGTFALACHNAGLNAAGLDIGEFQIEFAKRRAQLLHIEQENGLSYFRGDAQATELPDQSFNVISAWNLLEHVPDYRRLFGEAYRLLKPGGIFIGVAPNYLSFRREAHYGVPWIPMLYRPLAAKYLEWLGKRPSYFLESIYYITNWGVLRSLGKCGFSLLFPEGQRLRRPDLIVSPRLRYWVQKMQQPLLFNLLCRMAHAYAKNPFKKIIYFAGIKPL